MMPTDAEPRGSRIEDFVAEFFAARAGTSAAYEPREDSFLMLEALAELKLRGTRVLDVGTGSGILAAYCARRGADVTASDIDAGAIEDLGLAADRLRISMKLVACDLFSEIDDRFDIIVFNPPYLPSLQTVDRTTDGGIQGTRIIKRFLNQLSQHLAENGFGMLMVSSLNDPERLARNYPDLLFETVRQRSLFFEWLCVTRVRPKDPHRCDRSPHLQHLEIRSN